MMYDCTDCTFSGRPPYKYPCSGCYKSSKWAGKEKPITNADHIRSMSDEELANVISPHIAVRGACNCTRDWTEELLEWLKMPYKEKEE